MDNTVSRQAESMRRGRRSRRRWRKAFTSLAGIVVFVTVYMLILPAITMERDPACGLEEHVHGEGCYTPVLTCPLEETEGHAHSLDCLPDGCSPYGEPACGLEETDEPGGHRHTLLCYENLIVRIDPRTGDPYGAAQVSVDVSTETINLDGGEEESYRVLPIEDCWICHKEEKEAHFHGADCYAQTLICTLPEHEHNDACYPDSAESEAAEPQPVYACGLEEHAHTGDCCDGDGALVCTLPEHSHSEDCSYIIIEDNADNALDTEPEAEPSEAPEYICGLEEHQHTDGCYDENGELICELYEHTHSDECLKKPEPEYLCGLTEHEHTGECYDESGALVCALPEHIHAELCLTRAEELSGLVCRRVESLEELAPGAAFVLLQENEDGSAYLIINENGLDFAEASLEMAYDDKGGLVTALNVPGLASEDGLPLGCMWTPAAAENTDSPESALMTNGADAETALLVAPGADGGWTAADPAMAMYAEGGSGNEVSIYSLERAIAPKSVTTLEELQAALTEPVTDDNRDIILSNTIEIDTEEKLVLNGHTIKAGASGISFVIKENGSLTIREFEDDRKAADDKAIQESGVNANEAGKQAQAYYETLVYYVTETEVVSPLGATKETIYRHDVAFAGKIAGVNIVVEGGKFTLESGALGFCSGRAITANGGEINLNGGYICGCIEGGGVEANGATVNLSGTVIAGNVADKGAGISVINGSTLNMTGGVISGNEAATYGAGVYCDASTLNMTGGYITNNHVPDPPHPDDISICGGGIYLVGGSAGRAKLIVEGGYITANKAGSGGGICTFNADNTWGSGADIDINGGFITGNLATLHEGGGIACRASVVTNIRGGYITNNITNTSGDWGGGGIFGSEQSEITLNNALITENHAEGFGGGVTGCSTGTILVHLEDGAAIYANTANGDIAHMGSNEETGEGSNKKDAWIAFHDPVFMENGFNDFYGAKTSGVSGVMLGSGSANWKGSADGVAVTAEDFDPYVTAVSHMGLTAQPDEGAKSAAVNKAGVHINGNFSNTHGGGILVNGIMFAGQGEVQFHGSLTVNAKKALDGKLDLGDYEFAFILKDEAGETIATAKNDKNGLISFPKLKFEEAGTYTYFIEEVDPQYPEILKDETVYKFVVTVSDTETQGLKITRPTFWSLYVGDKEYWTGQECTAYKVGKNEDSLTDFYVNLYDRWFGENVVPHTFNNTFADEVSIEVHKVWKGVDGNILETPPKDSVMVYLTKNGERYESDNEVDKSPVTLNDGNNWSYTWEKLPGHDDSGNPISWGVEEEVPDGWESHITYSKPEPGGPGENPDPGEPGAGGSGGVTSIEGGAKYYITNGDKFFWINNNYVTNVIPGSRTEFEAIPVEDGSGGFYLKHDNYYIKCIRGENGNPNRLAYENSGTAFYLDENAYLKGSVLTPAGNDSGVTYFTIGKINGDDAIVFSETAEKAFYLMKDGSDGGSTDGSANSSVVTITNTPKTERPSYELPETGGSGTRMYTMAGLLLCGAAYLMYRPKKRRKGVSAS